MRRPPSTRVIQPNQKFKQEKEWDEKSEKGEREVGLSSGTGISSLNGHISKTAQNFIKMVPKFSAVRFFAIFGSYGSVFAHFLGVKGVAQYGSMAQNMPLGPLETGEQKNILPHTFYCLWQ